MTGYHIQHTTVYDSQDNKVIGELIAANVTQQGLQVIIILKNGQPKRLNIAAFPLEVD